MIDPVSLVDEKMMLVLEKTVSAAMKNAALGFSGLLGQSLTVAHPQVRLVPLAEIPMMNGGPENEAIGIYLQADGDLNGEIMMIIPYPKALELVDLLIDAPVGTTQCLGSFERSALAEVGNQTGTFFLNAVAEFIGGSVRPSPPSVMVDMIGAILDIIVATNSSVADQVVLMQTSMTNGDHSVETNFWVIPDIGTLSRLLKQKNVL